MHAGPRLAQRRTPEEADGELRDLATEGGSRRDDDVLGVPEREEVARVEGPEASRSETLRHGNVETVIDRGACKPARNDKANRGELIVDPNRLDRETVDELPQHESLGLE